MEEFNKITTGFVIQKYKTLDNGTYVCIGQEFVASDQVDYETIDGEHTTINPNNEVYCSFGMVQPKEVIDDVEKKYLNYYECPDCDRKWSEECDSSEREDTCPQCCNFYSPYKSEDI